MRGKKEMSRKLKRDLEATDYVMGELPVADKEQLERDLKTDPGLSSEVDSTKQLSEQLQTLFEAEPRMGLTPDQKNTLTQRPVAARNRRLPSLRVLFYAAIAGLFVFGLIQSGIAKKAVEQVFSGINAKILMDAAHSE